MSDRAVMEGFAENLRRERKRADLSQEELGFLADELSDGAPSVAADDSG